jgi:hypothetical protein
MSLTVAYCFPTTIYNANMSGLEKALFNLKVR